MTEASRLAQFSEYKEADPLERGRIGDRELQRAAAARPVLRPGAHARAAHLPAGRAGRGVRLRLRGAPPGCCGPEACLARACAGCSAGPPLAAILRTIEGAQWMVVVDHMSCRAGEGPLPRLVGSRHHRGHPAFGARLPGAVLQGMTAAVAGGFTCSASTSAASACARSSSPRTAPPSSSGCVRRGAQQLRAGKQRGQPLLRVRVRHVEWENHS